MSRIRGKDTKPELLLRSMLHRLGLRYRLHVSGLPGKPDLVLKKYRTVILVNGCYWHRHPGCERATTPDTRREFWLAKFRDTVARDKRNRASLIDMGWQVVTVWECELERDPGGVLDGIRNCLGEVVTQ